MPDATPTHGTALPPKADVNLPVPERTG